MKKSQGEPWNPWWWVDREKTPSPFIDHLRKIAPRNRVELLKSVFHRPTTKGYRKLFVPYWPHQGQQECARRRNKMAQRELPYPWVKV